jgi:uncharacterized membrane protein (DUF106 family)
MREEPQESDTPRRVLIGILAIIQAVFVFFLAQATVRLFQMRDTINELQTAVARLQERQDHAALLTTTKIDNVQRHLDRLEQQMHPQHKEGAR